MTSLNCRSIGRGSYPSQHLIDTRRAEHALAVSLERSVVCRRQLRERVAINRTELHFDMPTNELTLALQTALEATIEASLFSRSLH